MTQPNLHRIQRQVFEIAIGRGVSGPSLQAALAHGFHTNMLPALADVFDSVVGAQRLLQLDRVEIDLGAIAGADWQPELQRRLVSEMARRLGEHREERPPEPLAGSADSFRQFLFFLQHGRLPWWAPRALESWADCLPRDSAAREWGLLRTTLLAEPRARIRCADVLSDAMLSAALVAWCGVGAAAQLFALLTPAGLPAAIASPWRRRFWLLLIDWALASGPDRMEGAALVRALLDLRRAHAQATSAASDVVPPATQTHPQIADPPHEAFPQPWRAWYEQALQRVSGRYAAQPRHRPADEETATRTPTGAAPPAGHAARSQDDSTSNYPPTAGTAHSRHAARQPARRKPELAAEEDAIYLTGAGTILLHPFLESLFRDRGLLAGRVFRDATARQRGVRLLGYLGFGIPEVPEHDLLLAKLLCDHALEEPLDPLVLEPEDLAACDALLAAVLGHWTALRSSSAAWLRAQFLLREGKLECVDEGHRLTVERHAQDVLLGRIPWGFGVIALPWMPGRLFVHWLD